VPSADGMARELPFSMPLWYRRRVVVLTRIPAWPRSVRLYSTKSFKPLGRLDYHRDTCHVVAFPTLRSANEKSSSAAAGTSDGLEDDESDLDDDGMTTGAAGPVMERWLASGGLDGRVAVWALMDFERQGGG
jgi:hypothetical protein